MEHFDPESGQVYRETLKQPRRFKEWQLSMKGQKPRHVLSPNGCDTLKATILRKFVCYADQLSPDVLAAVPAGIALQLLAAIRREGCETFNTFKSFAQSGHLDKNSRYATDVTVLDQPFVNFVLDMSSPNFSWMVDLTLSDLYCSRLDLRELHGLNNLSTLSVSYQQETGQEPIDDGVLSNLAYRAATGNCLRRLCMLFIRNSQGISAKSLGWISQFPALETFCVMGTGIKSKGSYRSKVEEWRITIDTTFHSYFEERKARGAYESSLPILGYNDLVRRYIQKHRSSTITSYGDLPLADVTLGLNRLGPTSAQCILSRLRCFVRQRNVRPADETPSSLAISPKSENHQGMQKPPMKKRKLKATKSIQLDKMLEGI